jgi:hypothetical protein
MGEEAAIDRKCVRSQQLSEWFYWLYPGILNLRIREDFTIPDILVLNNTDIRYLRYLMWAHQAS